jgi:hypothetical protein
MATPSVFMLGETDLNRIFEKHLMREQMLGMLCNAPIGDAIGVACAFLAHAAEQDPGRVRAVLQSLMQAHDGRVVQVSDLITLRS